VAWIHPIDSNRRRATVCAQASSRIGANVDLDEDRGRRADYVATAGRLVLPELPKRATSSGLRDGGLERRDPRRVMMKKDHLVAALIGIAVLGLPLVAAAQQKADFGKREYDANCAVCHGTAGKGDGPYAGIIDTRIPDLTTLSKRNGGVFPMARVYDLIDGTAVVKAHGTRDMPIWGQDYRIKAAEYYGGFPYDAEAYVRARILGLAEYLNRLQVK
jgi:mono/diheme cytochrome c family protein